MKWKRNSELSVLAGKYWGSLNCSQRHFDHISDFLELRGFSVTLSFSWMNFTLC